MKLYVLRLPNPAARDGGPRHLSNIWWAYANEEKSIKGKPDESLLSVISRWSAKFGEYEEIIRLKSVSPKYREVQAWAQA